MGSSLTAPGPRPRAPHSLHLRIWIFSVGFVVILAPSVAQVELVNQARVLATRVREVPVEQRAADGLRVQVQYVADPEEAPHLGVLALEPRSGRGGRSHVA